MVISLAEHQRWGTAEVEVPDRSERGELPDVATPVLFSPLRFDEPWILSLATPKFCEKRVDTTTVLGHNLSLCPPNFSNHRICLLNRLINGLHLLRVLLGSIIQVNARQRK